VKYSTGANFSGHQFAFLNLRIVISSTNDSHF
jgi:hypothetical protein